MVELIFFFQWSFGLLMVCLVKNRAKEILELLENDEKIRSERIKAKGFSFVCI